MFSLPSSVLNHGHPLFVLTKNSLFSVIFDPENSIYSCLRLFSAEIHACLRFKSTTDFKCHIGINVFFWHLLWWYMIPPL